MVRIREDAFGVEDVVFSRFRQLSRNVSAPSADGAVADHSSVVVFFQVVDGDASLYSRDFSFAGRPDVHDDDVLFFTKTDELLGGQRFHVRIL